MGTVVESEGTAQDNSLQAGARDPVQISYLAEEEKVQHCSKDVEFRFPVFEGLDSGFDCRKILQVYKEVFELVCGSRTRSRGLDRLNRLRCFLLGATGNVYFPTGFVGNGRELPPNARHAASDE